MTEAYILGTQIFYCEKCKRRMPHSRRGYNRVKCSNCGQESEYKEVFDFA